MKLKIRDKVIGIMIVMVLVPILLLGLSSYRASTKMAKKQYNEMGTVIAEQAKVAIENEIDETNKILERLVLDPSVINVTEATKFELKDEFRRAREVHEFKDVYFAATDGTMHMASDTDTTGIVIQERPWYINATESEDAVWSEVYQDSVSGENVVTVSKAVYDSAGTLKGVMAIDVDLSVISKAINQVDIMGGQPIVMDNKGIILIDKNPDWIGQEFKGKDDFKSDAEGIQVKENTFEDDIKGTVMEQLIVFSGIDGSDWYIATIIGMDGLAHINSMMIRNIIYVGLFTILIGIVIAIIFGKNIANSINKVLEAIRKMEQGDFTTRIMTKSTDEFGDVRESFNKMMETLTMFIGKIKTASMSVDEYSGNLAAISEEVSASSLEVSSTAEEIAKGASNQADDTEEGVALVGRLSDKIIELEKTSKDMVSLAENIRKTSSNSEVVVEDLKVKTDLNNESSKRVEQEIMELDRRIGEVSEILSTIDAISEQTNLLALNASIEAARAGEYGKGFAVVAEEIRKLAGESKESSNNIKNIIEAVQDESKSTVEVVAEVNSRNEEQTEAVTRVNESFETINDIIEEIVSKIRDIDRQSSEMSDDRDNIVSSIENISAISEETAAASEEVTASIEQQTSATEEVANSATKLNELANDLNAEISVFKI